MTRRSGWFEIAEIEMKPDSEAAFGQAVMAATPRFRASDGCRSLELQQRIFERPAIYRLVVGWDTDERHTIHRKFQYGTVKRSANSV